MRIIGLIPARGGSKGISRKNLRNLNGIPLVGHKIIQAQKSACTEVWVSSEDDEIRNTSIKFGASIILRPHEISLDESSTDQVLVHALNYLSAEEGDLIVLLQPTSPTIKIQSINRCIQKIINEKNLNSVITIRESHTFSWVAKNDLAWEPQGHDRFIRKRRQELPKSGWETGGCYVIRVTKPLEGNTYHQAPTGVITLDHLESLDIDTIDDLREASKILSVCADKS
jgi:CMP-N,N'-diacetyllegionaminic acid synthase